jgi:hypothetical protein
MEVLPVNYSMVQAGGSLINVMEYKNKLMHSRTWEY